MRRYLHCPSFSQFLHSPAITFFFKSDTEKHLNDGSRSHESDDELLEERSLTRSRDSCVDELSAEAEPESSLASLRLGMQSCSISATSLNRRRHSRDLALSSRATSQRGERARAASRRLSADTMSFCSWVAIRVLASLMYLSTSCTSRSMSITFNTSIYATMQRNSFRGEKIKVNPHNAEIL